jgi:hypothetical protein
MLLAMTGERLSFHMLYKSQTILFFRLDWIAVRRVGLRTRCIRNDDESANHGFLVRAVTSVKNVGFATLGTYEEFIGTSSAINSR